jgi:hypothetical protein
MALRPAAVGITHIRPQYTPTAALPAAVSITHICTRYVAHTFFMYMCIFVV